MQEHHCITQVPLFSQLAPEELAKVEQVVQHQSFQKGELVLSPVQAPRLVIVAKGALKIYRLSASGKEQLLRVIEPGGYEGEAALFGVVNENMFGEVIKDSVVCFVKSEAFKELLMNNPALSLKLLEINAQKAEQTEQQAAYLVMESIENRLAHYLLQLAKATESLNFVLPMKMKDLANFLGTTPETLSRKFKGFEMAQCIERQGKKIYLLDPMALEAHYT